MPGLHLVYKFNQFNDGESEIIGNALRKCLHHQDYIVKTFYDSRQLKIYSTGYDDYPVRIFNSDEHLVILEGRIYNKSNDRILSEVKKIYDSIQLNNFSYLEFWLKETDGDFIITIINPETSDWWMLNDYLGRLPFYLYKSNKRIIISREILFYKNVLNEIRFDKIGISESLLFGYPLKERTLFYDINRIPPATLFYFNNKKQQFSRYKILELDLNTHHYDNTGAKLKEQVETAAELFKTGVKNRLDSSNWTIISLSGGLDSRSVAAASVNKKEKLIAATYLGYNKVAQNDSLIAKKIADELKLNWKLYQIDKPKFSNALSLLKYKCGMNTLLSSFLLEFYESLLDDYQRTTIYITGDGGDKVFPDHRAPNNSWNTDTLINYTISTKYFLKLKLISKLLGVSALDIRDDIKDTFLGYPESDLRDKFKRFIIAERGIKWLFEAEDRNRFYFQSIAPMYSIPFFNFMMKVDDNLKAGHLFYNSFMDRLHPGINKFENALWGMPINNNLNYRIFLFVKDRIYPFLPAAAKRRLRIRLNKMDFVNLKSYPVMLEIWNNLLKQEEIEHVFSVDVLKRVKNLSKAEFYLLFTALLAVEFLTTGKSSIEPFTKNELI